MTFRCLHVKGYVQAENTDLNDANGLPDSHPVAFLDEQRLSWGRLSIYSSSHGCYNLNTTRK
jgi:hypothetical protein